MDCDMEKSLIDFEEKLDMFTICKRNRNINENSKATEKAKSLNIKYSIPLLLVDLHRLKQRSDTHSIAGENNSLKVFEVFNGAITFRHCILHGRIVSHRTTSCSHMYTIDDGTALADAIIFKQWEELDLKKLSKLQCDVAEITRRNQNKLLQSLNRIINKTKTHVDNSNIPINSKVLIIGTPDFYRNKISIIVQSLFRDSSTNRDLEIVFKEELIEFYTELKQ